MIPDEREQPVLQRRGAHVGVAGVARAAAQRRLREAQVGHVPVCGAEDGMLGVVEGALRRRVVVAVVRPRGGGGEGGDGAREGAGGYAAEGRHLVFVCVWLRGLVVGFGGCGLA